MCPWAAAHAIRVGYPGPHLARRLQMTGPRADPKAPSGSLLVPPLYACLPQQLAVLLLGHSLAALLDDGAHNTTLARRSQGPAGMPAHARHPPAGAHANVFTRQRHRLPPLLGILSQR